MSEVSAEPSADRRVVRVLPDVAGHRQEFDYLVPGGSTVAPRRPRCAWPCTVAGSAAGSWRGTSTPPPACAPAARQGAAGTGRARSSSSSPRGRRGAGRVDPRSSCEPRRPPRSCRGPAPASRVTRGGRAGSPGRGRWSTTPWTGPCSGRATAPGRRPLRLPGHGGGSGPTRGGPCIRDAGLDGRPPSAAPSVLVVCPSIDAARRLAVRLRRTGLPVALVADDRRGGRAQRVGPGRTSGPWWWAPGGGLGAGPRPPLAVVLDEHDEALQEERAPTWHARDVVVERARRAGAPCLLLSPCPTLEALAWGTLVAVHAAWNGAGWPLLDRRRPRQRGPRTSSLLSSPALVDLARGDGRVVCVLNRTGRARLLACRSCADAGPVRGCGAAVEQPEPGLLRCRRCGTGAADDLPGLRLDDAHGVAAAGVSRVREELEALARRAGGRGHRGRLATTALARDARVVIGTEAVLHRVRRADVVAFLDIDQELTAPRYRAGGAGPRPAGARGPARRRRRAGRAGSSCRPAFRTTRCSSGAARRSGTPRGRRASPARGARASRRRRRWRSCRALAPRRSSRRCAGRAAARCRGAGPDRRGLAGAGARPRGAGGRAGCGAAPAGLRVEVDPLRI